MPENAHLHDPDPSRSRSTKPRRCSPRGEYVADRSLATSLFLALAMKRPLFLEGEAGVGKTEIAKVVAQALGRELIRLQCYEGLDIAQAAYEWNYSRQMIEIRLAEAAGEKSQREPRAGHLLASDSWSSARCCGRCEARRARRRCC